MSWRPASVVRRLAGHICSGYAGQRAFGVRVAEVARRGRFGRCVWNAAIADIKPRLTAGTIFQDTRKPLVLWFRTMWSVTSQKNGASALGLQRVLGLGSYKTAWTWLHKLRRAMVRPGRDRLTGRVEVDETFVGGLEEGVRGRHTETK